jgi:hypothetical protein
MDSKGEMKFAYIDKILKNWHAQGWKKPGDIVDTKAPVGRTPHTGLTDLEKMGIGMMQGGED